MKSLQPPSLQDVESARRRIAPFVYRTPLVRLNAGSDQNEIYLKLENLQPIGSFKIRGAGNAMELAGPAGLQHGVFTASAGNMGQGVAWNAQRLRVPCTVVVPDHAPDAKISALNRLNAGVIKVPFEEWWKTMVSHQYPGLDGFFIHPVSDEAVMAGNGTIALEVLEDLPDVGAVLVPYGGGGLSCGIASVIRALKPDVKVIGCEVDTATPLAASLSAGAPCEVQHTPSFVDGIGGKSLLQEMWPLVSRLIDGAIVVSLKQIAEAIRLLVERNRIVAEGAGAASVAAALSRSSGPGKTVCIVSGGNLDPAKLAAILRNELP